MSRSLPAKEVMAAVTSLLVAQRDAGQLEADGPAVRPRGEDLHVVVAEVTLGHRGQQLSGLVLPEGEVGAAQLDEPSVEAQSSQGPRWVSAGADDASNRVR